MTPVTTTVTSTDQSKIPSSKDEHWILIITHIQSIYFGFSYPIYSILFHKSSFCKTKAFLAENFQYIRSKLIRHLGWTKLHLLGKWTVCQSYLPRSSCEGITHVFIDKGSNDDLNNTAPHEAKALTHVVW